MKIVIAATLIALGLAAPVIDVESKAMIAGRDGPFSCPSGITNSSPMCCSVNVLGLLSLDCKSPGSNGCTGSQRANCCTLGLAGQGVICNEF